MEVARRAVVSIDRRQVITKYILLVCFAHLLSAASGRADVPGACDGAAMVDHPKTKTPT